MNIFFKKCVFAFSLLLLAGCIFDSDEKDVEPWNAEAVCPADGTNAYGMPNRGTFTDERDGEVYKYTTIGDQVWMAENLRYDAPYSMCSNDTSFIRQYCELIEHKCETETCCKESLCRTFGRYYSIIEDGAEFGLIDSKLADTICPKGWHIPTKNEWKELGRQFRTENESESSVIDRMKSDDSVFFVISKFFPNKNSRMFVGNNDCLFSVIPSGFMVNEGMFYESGAFFLTSTQKNVDFVYSFKVSTEINFLNHEYRNTIRCVMD